MSLTSIAEYMKRQARRNGRILQTPLPKGASLILECVVGKTAETFTLTIMRRGIAPTAGSSAAAKWQTEIKTFAKYFVPEGVAYAETPATPQETPRGFYAVCLKWDEALPGEQSKANEGQDPKAEPCPQTIKTQPPAHDNSLPRTREEMAAWAATLGPGVHVTHVNVFTGEM